MPQERTRTGGPRRRSEVPLRLTALAVGGSLGTLSRYGLSRALATPALGFPWPTFLANIAGSLVLGIVITVAVERWTSSRARFLRPFAAIGFCGGFTTFSTLMVESAQLGRHERIGQATLYLAVTLGGGILAAAVGVALGRWRLPVSGRRPIPDPDDLGPMHAASAMSASGPGPGPAPPEPVFVRRRGDPDGERELS